MTILRNPPDTPRTHPAPPNTLATLTDKKYHISLPNLPIVACVKLQQIGCGIFLNGFFLVSYRRVNPERIPPVFLLDNVEHYLHRHY